MSAARREGGFTLHELLVNVAVLGTFLAGVFAFVSSGMADAERTMARAVVDQRANEAINRIADLLLPAGDATLSPAAAPLGAGFVDYQTPAAVTAAGIAWEDVARLERQPDPADPDDGIDNNGDGRIDEGLLVLRRSFGLAGEQSTVLASGVARWLEGEIDNALDDNGNGLEDEAGLAFERTAAGGIVIRLTLEHSHRSGLYRRTVEATVWPRN
ncbi:MAG: hypothetical protein JNL90_14985 [Planctomycetes bacterium]|nr:hypothetical protein [Planctomycetota bacterium]